MVSRQCLVWCTHKTAVDAFNGVGALFEDARVLHKLEECLSHSQHLFARQQTANVDDTVAFIRCADVFNGRVGGQRLEP